MKREIFMDSTTTTLLDSVDTLVQSTHLQSVATVIALGILILIRLVLQWKGK